MIICGLSWTGARHDSFCRRRHQLDTERFIDAAHESGKLKLSAVYSRSLEQAQAFGANYQVTQFFDSLEAMAQSDAIDAVYIASPNSLHCRNRCCSCAIKST